MPAESQSESHWDVVGNLDRSARIAISSAGSPATVASLRILPSTGAVISTAVAPSCVSDILPAHTARASNSVG